MDLWWLAGKEEKGFSLIEAATADVIKLAQAPDPHYARAHRRTWFGSSRWAAVPPSDVLDTLLRVPSSRDVIVPAWRGRQPRPARYRAIKSQQQGFQGRTVLTSTDCEICSPCRPKLTEPGPRRNSAACICLHCALSRGCACWSHQANVTTIHSAHRPACKRTHCEPDRSTSSPEAVETPTAV